MAAFLSRPQCVNWYQGMNLVFSFILTQIPLPRSWSLVMILMSSRNQYPCAVCCKGVSNNFKCSPCKLWVHKKCSGITGRLVAKPNYACPMCNGESRPSTADQWFKIIATAPSLMWRPLSVTWVTCCTPLGAVAVPLLPGVVWPGESSQNYCSLSSTGTSLLRCVARCAQPALHGSKTWGVNTSDLEWLHLKDRAMICWICCTKDQDD